MRLKAAIFSLLIAIFPLASYTNANVCERLFAVKSAKFGNLNRLIELDLIKNYIQATEGKVTIVVDSEDIPSGMNQSTINFLYGAKVIVVGKNRAPKKPKKIPGVVLHLGDADFLKEYVVGDLDLVKGWGNLNQKFDNKVFEVEWALSLDPNIMPPSLKFNQIDKDLFSTKSGPELFSRILAIKKQMIGDSEFHFSSAERDTLVQYLDLVMNLVNVHFPMGAVIKHAREFQTGDTGGIIKSNKNNSADIVDQFITSFYKIRKSKLKTGEEKLSSKDFDEDTESAEFNKRYTLVQSLIYGQFEELMAQQLLKIKREIRLDVARGNVINVVDRFDEIWGPPELFSAAKEFVNKFFEKVPLPYKLMAGGVDIALLEDGSFVIIDFNFGATSGFLDGPKAPVTANMYVANLIDKKTPLLEELSLIGGLPADKKPSAIKLFAKKYLRHLSAKDRESVMHDIPRWLRHENLIDAAEEAALLPQ